MAGKGILPTGNPHAWKKGKSGNPGGRTKEHQQSLARLERLTVQAVNVVEEALKSADLERRDKAAALVISYNFAKPQPVVQVDITVDSLDASDEAAARLMRERFGEMKIYDPEESTH